MSTRRHRRPCFFYAIEDIILLTISGTLMRRTCHSGSYRSSLPCCFGKIARNQSKHGTVQAITGSDTYRPVLLSESTDNFKRSVLSQFAEGCPMIRTARNYKLEILGLRMGRVSLGTLLGEGQ